MSNSEELQFLNSTIKQYLTISDEIKTLSSALSDRRNKRDNLSKFILNFIKENNIKEINLEGDYKGKQICETITKSTKTKKNNIREALEELFKDDTDTINKVIECIDNKSEVKEISRLKINKCSKQKRRKDNIEELLNDGGTPIPEHLKYLLTDN
tara:strand:+ start:2714 stop:3178 length:465 start_codon:yes stop_codon:yes gene_type:complete